MAADVDGNEYRTVLVRAFVDTKNPESEATFSVIAELYMRDITDRGPIGDNEIDAALWTDIDRHGFVDEKGMHYPDFGHKIRMYPKRGEGGEQVCIGNNTVFVSEPVKIKKTGVFSFTAMFSADGLDFDDPAKEWISINEIAHNRDGVIVVSDSGIRDCPSLMEICVRKYGARVENGRFISGKIKNVTNDIENIPVDILYLLPFFEPGTGDAITGRDVRKGELGSIYAVKDFFRIDPELCTPPESADFHALISKKLINDYDLIDLLTEKQGAVLQRTSDFGHFGTDEEIVAFLGRDTAVQLIGRAEMRELAREAHKRGKRVIFDLVLMQTSRDSKLINEHRDWYALDENGIPKIHQIAWLVYSDVALFDLLFNRPLQNYLSSVAPYWIKSCELDGVRIDASQTVDRVFLKQIKNRINEVRPDAIILGETLCPVCEAVDIPVDIIYSLLVDHHVNIEQARPYYDLFEMYHHTFAHRTHAISYFENHDSRRATAQWHTRFAELLRADPAAKVFWSGLAGVVSDTPENLMAALKNLQCSLINMVSGSADGTNFCYALENGTDYGERERTDFENKTLLNFGLREEGAGALLHSAYKSLHKLRTKLSLVCCGKVFYLRDNLEDGQDDRVFALVRYDAERRLLFLANLDPATVRIARFSFGHFNLKPLGKYPFKVLLDSFEMFGLKSYPKPGILQGGELAAGLAAVKLAPLQSVLLSF